MPRSGSHPVVLPARPHRPGGVPLRVVPPLRLALATTLIAVAATSGVAGVATDRAAAATDRAAAAPVTDGDARFEVLTPTLVRMEYAGDGKFQDAATLNAVNRSFPAAAFTTTVTSDGYREIRTSALTLRYKQNSGPFTPNNLSVTLAGGATGAPAFPSTCQYATLCEAETALLTGHASTAYDHTGRTGSGFVAGFEATGSGIVHDVSAVPAAGTYRLAVRYANAKGSDGQTASRTLSTRINGSAGPTITLPATANWDTWATAAVTVNLAAGTNAVSVLRAAADSGRVNLDSIAVTPTSSTAYPGGSTALTATAYGAGPTGVLGGWVRSLDNPASVPVPEHPGVLNRGGWYLLDDSRTALLNADHTITDRPTHGTQPYQDGYLFGYGTDYRQALADLNALTGPSALLPRSAYGVWFSRYYAYSAADYRNTLIPAFRSGQIPIDWLVIDTDWKSPRAWNGWNWNTGLLGDSQSLLDWASGQGLSVSLNIHPSIDSADPKFATANSQAGGLTVDSGNTYRFDWSDPKQLAAYLNLHRPFEQQGVRAWWLDYCTGCGGSTTSNPHVAPDNLINQAYADEHTGRGVRGFSFARIGGAEYGGITSSYPTGPWSERRNTLQFTGDTPATWPMLAYAVRFTADEAAAGLSNVSHDIGSFHGGHLADDLYARWVQFGTFQPVARLHSDHGDRLPWEYTGAASSAATRFLRLREALVPLTYTLARQAADTGVPIVRPVYLNHPGYEAAYQAGTEYLYGDDVLVAPITSPNDANGNGSVSAWIPPGAWTDYFTGTTYTGPATVTLTAPMSRMPVLVRSGGIMPTRTDFVEHQGSTPTQLTVHVAAGASGSFQLYEDAGEGAGYRDGQSTRTPLSWNDAGHTLTVGATAGSYPGAATGRAYTLRLANSTAPTAVAVDGVTVPQTAWSYNANTRTVTVTTATLSTSSAHSVTLSGSANANPTSGVVVGPGGLCLDVRDGTSADRQPVQLSTCNHSAAQLFTHRADGSMQVLGRCLEAAGGATANGTLIQLYTCNSTPAQQWTRRPDGSLLHPASGRCLDDPSGNTTPGAVQLQLYTCQGGTAQTWRLPPGALVGNNLCVDVADADPAAGTAIQLYGCNDSDAQRWSAPGDGSIRALGKCLDVARGATGNNTPVQLWDCNGTGSQTWVSRADGTLQNPQSGRCLDDPDNAAKAGDRLRIHDCNTTTAQRFQLR